MNRRSCSAIGLSVLLITGACSTDMNTMSPTEAGRETVSPAPMDPLAATTVTMERPVHFAGPAEAEVLVPAGQYQVQAGEASQIKLLGKDQAAPLVLAAVAVTHEEKIGTPVARLVAGEEDTQRIFLLTPGGTGLAAVGSESGVGTRGIFSQLGGLSGKHVDLSCKIMICPKITKVVPFVSMITPGGPVVIEGLGFGMQPGEIRLIGTAPKGLGSFQGGYLRLEDVQFGGTWVYGKIPDVTAVLDQPAKLVVVTRDGASSNAVDVQFRASQDLIPLPQQDVKVIRCGFDSNEDHCNNVMDPGDNQELMPYIIDTALSAAHENCWGCVGDDMDFDDYEIRLKNQWRLQNVDWWISDSVQKGEASIEVINGIWDYPPGAATVWIPTIQWRVTPNDLLVYSVHVDIVGPKDIPYK